MNYLDNMDDKVINIVREYNYQVLGNNKPFRVLITWKCKTIQNYKYLVITTLSDDRYYEVTYNGDEEEFYLDVYKKQDKRIIFLKDIDN